MRQLGLFLLLQKSCYTCVRRVLNRVVGENLPADTAFFTFSVSSLLCSRYSVSSKRCFFPATMGGVSVDDGRGGSPDPTAGVLDDSAFVVVGSMPSLRSRASSLAF